MPEAIVTRILRLSGYGVYAWEADEETNTLTLAIRQTAREPYYVCGGCGIAGRYVHSWTERPIRDLPCGTWRPWCFNLLPRRSGSPLGRRTSLLPCLTRK